MWAVVGLGNPGKDYSGTRHNVGFTFIKKVAKNWNVRIRKKIYQSKAAIVERNEKKVLLAMPQTYMNNSGWAVKQIVEEKKIKPENLVVVYDDLDIPLGEIRVRKVGGPGSHRGMNSIIQEINITSFARIRVGIGPFESGSDASAFVLSLFKEEEKTKLDISLEQAREAMELILTGEINKAMNIYNKKKKIPEN